MLLNNRCVYTYLNIIVTKGPVELRLQATRRFDIPSLVEVGDDFVHFADTYICIHGNIFYRHDCTEANDDPVNISWDLFATSHGGNGMRLTFPFWNAFVSSNGPQPSPAVNCILKTLEHLEYIYIDVHDNFYDVM